MRVPRATTHSGPLRSALASLTVSLALGACQQAARETASSTTPPPRKIAYDSVERWSIPNGGYGNVLVIKPEHRNEVDLRLLGDQLRAETRSDRHAAIFVYDDARAASLRKAAFTESLSKTDLAFHDQHMVGNYQKNNNTGYERFSIMLEGVDGPSIDVTY
jgi:hypothetical protein